jgi:hypothetical protein
MVTPMRGIHRLQMRLGGPDSSQHVWTSRNDSDSNAAISTVTLHGVVFRKLSIGSARNTLGDSIGHWAQAGADFIDENGGGPGVRLRKRHQKKS